MSANGHPHTDEKDESKRRDNVPKKIQISLLEGQLKRTERIAKRLKTALTVVYYERAMAQRAQMEDQEEAQREALDEAMDRAQKVELGQ